MGNSTKDGLIPGGNNNKDDMGLFLGGMSKLVSG